MKQWKPEENRLQNKKVLTHTLKFRILKIHFLTSWYESIWASWWCHRVTIKFCAQKWQRFNISAINVRLANSFLNRCRIMLTPIQLDWGTLSQVLLNFSKFYVQKYMASSEAMTSSTRSFAYSYRLVKKCISENLRNCQSVITSLFFNKYHQVLTVLFTNFYSFFWN